MWPLLRVRFESGRPVAVTFANAGPSSDAHTHSDARAIPDSNASADSSSDADASAFTCSDVRLDRHCARCCHAEGDR